MTTTTDNQTARALGASQAATALMIEHAALVWEQASSSRADGKLTINDVRSFIERASEASANTGAAEPASFVPADARTWGLDADLIATMDKDAKKAADGFQRTDSRLDHMMLDLTRAYAHAMGIQSGVEPGATKLDPFTKGMKAAFPNALKVKAFASYSSHCKRALSYGVIPFETEVTLPCVRYAPKQNESSGTVRVLEHAKVRMESIGAWKSDNWLEPFTKRAGLRAPAMRKHFGDVPVALRDAQAWIAGDAGAPPKPGDAGSEILADLNPTKDVPIVKEVADELRRATKAGCLSRAREILADAIAAIESAVEEKVRAA